MSVFISSDLDKSNEKLLIQVEKTMKGNEKGWYHAKTRQRRERGRESRNVAANQHRDLIMLDSLIQHAAGFFPSKNGRRCKVRSKRDMVLGRHLIVFAQKYPVPGTIQSRDKSVVDSLHRVSIREQNVDVLHAAKKAITSTILQASTSRFDRETVLIPLVVAKRTAAHIWKIWAHFSFNDRLV